MPEAGTSLPVTVYIELDPDSFRFIAAEPIEGNRVVLYQERRPICWTTGFQAEGTMIVLDQDGATVATAPLVIRRDSENDGYLTENMFSPISSFSAQLHALHEFDIERIHPKLHWSRHSVWFYAEFDFIGEPVLPDSPEGHSAGFIARGDVAVFEMP